LKTPRYINSLVWKKMSYLASKTKVMKGTLHEYKMPAA
jgi:hypothetical protein